MVEELDPILNNLNSIKLLNTIKQNSMKSKIILLIASAAVITLSFTFAKSSPVEQKEATTTTQEQSFDAPAGGLALEDKE